jgi:hypothetical protein
MARKKKHSDRAEYAEGATAMKEGKGIGENPYPFFEKPEELDGPSPKKAPVNIPHLAWKAGYENAEEEAAAEAREAREARAARPLVRSLPGRRLLVRHNFSPEERLALAEKITEAQRRIDQAEAEKKRAATQFKSRIEGAIADREEASSAFQTGYEMRECACTCVADDPEPGWKTFYREDTGALVKTEEMSAEDRQLPLPISGAPGATGGDDADDPDLTESGGGDDDDDEATATDGGDY